MSKISNQVQVKVKAQQLYNDAVALYGIDNKNPLLFDFSLTGKTAGQAVYSLTENRLRFNQYMLDNNFDTFMNDTVPHEVAHIVADLLYSKRGRYIKPHGIEWKMIMRKMGYNPTRCHNYAIDESSTGGRQHFVWGCTNPKCNKRFVIGKNKHGKVCRNTKNFQCATCKSPIQFLGTDKPL